jgi:hypothetical protein
VSKEWVDRSIDVDRPYVDTTHDALRPAPVGHVSASAEGAAQVASVEPYQLVPVGDQLGRLAIGSSDREV